MQEILPSVKSTQSYSELQVIKVLDSELITHNLCTQGFHIIDDFLQSHIFNSLQSKAKKMYTEGLFRSAKIGLQLQANQNKTIRTDEICWLEDETAEPSIQAYLNRTNELANMLNQTLFLGLTEFETHFATYQPGAFYKKHIDQFKTTKTRRISCVYYLNDFWESSYGGELLIYDKKETLVQQVMPQGNRFICFNSDLPHEVCITNQPRYSITGWMKTRPF